MTCAVRSISFVLIVCIVTGAPMNLVAQNTGPPKGVVDVINEVELGMQVHGGVQYRNQTAIPFRERTLNYLQRPVSGDMSFTMPYYGVGVALRARGATLTFTYQFGDGVQSGHWIQFRGGGTAIPFKPDFKDWSIRAAYFVTDWIGLGLIYRDQSVDLRQSFDSRINGEIVRSVLFNANSDQGRVTGYIPIQRQWGSVRFFGRFGASIFGVADEYYGASFIMYQSPDNPGRVTVQDPDGPVGFEKTGSSLNTQFGRVGTEVPVWQTTLRASVGVERLAVPDWTRTWSYDVHMEVGLPF